MNALQTRFLLRRLFGRGPSDMFGVRPMNLNDSPSSLPDEAITGFCSIITGQIWSRKEGMVS